jgi:hypothetical protein
MKVIHFFTDLAKQLPRKTLAIGGLVCLLIPIFLITMAFRNQGLEPAEYIKWLEDPKNGLLVKGITDDEKFQLNLQYTPNEVLAFQSLTPEQRANISGSRWDSLVNSYNKIDYFKLDISSTTLQDPLTEDTKAKEDYYEKLNYLTFDMQHKISLVCQKDTLPCVLYHYERTYNTTNFCRVMLAFDTEKIDRTAPRQLIIQDDRLGIDTVGFSFANAKFKEIPNLKIN